MKYVKNSICGTGVRSIGVNAEGKYIPCPAMPQTVIGDALCEKIEDVWQRPQMKVFRTKTLEKFDSCGECGLRYACFGGCRAHALAATGSLTACDQGYRKGFSWLKEHSFDEVPSFYSAEEVGRVVQPRLSGEHKESVEIEDLGPWVPYTAPTLLARSRLAFGALST
jgi:radical SAM protein with 4Fe4S-binding SPASM domain